MGGGIEHLTVLITMDSVHRCTPVSVTHLIEKLASLRDALAFPNDIKNCKDALQKGAVVCLNAILMM